MSETTVIEAYVEFFENERGQELRCTQLKPGFVWFNPRHCRVTLEPLPIEPVEPPVDRYPMGDDQPAEIDCRRTDCRYYAGGGKCVNVAPAITLNDDGTAVCWSQKNREPELKPCPGFHEADSSPVVTVNTYGRFAVTCPCGFSGPERWDKLDAIAAWNRRA